SGIMSKKLDIKIYAEGKVGRVDIIGDISEWNDNNAMRMRESCKALKDSGISKCSVYLMTNGGDCFQANEIVNILHQEFGTYECEGGALVASAGTYIMVNGENPELAKNGQFMIHKPSGAVWGNENDMENYLTLLKNMTVTYYDSYVAVLKKPESEFKEKWDGGDFWMTAQEAKEWGFVSKVKGEAQVNDETNALLTAMGRPIIPITNKNYKDMNLEATAVSLGMDKKSTQEQVDARIAANAQKAKDYDGLKARQEQKDKDEKTAKIKVKLDAGEKDKRINATARAGWQTQFEKDFEGTSALFDGLQAVAAPLSDTIIVAATGTKGATYQGKTFEELQDEAPETLEALMESDPDSYNALFADWNKRNNKK
ncbi:MAG: Clp protease ClpP, partial [Bacteroidales bacterium]|nr:Clp protease ClpP [Bacteroidales bacterium]